MRPRERALLRYSHVRLASSIDRLIVGGEPKLPVKAASTALVQAWKKRRAVDIMTVTGQIRPAELGLTLPHEHLFSDLLIEYRSAGALNDEELVIEELALFASTGGRTVVDLTCDEVGRNPAGLARISRATGVQIVMGCGHYRDPYLDRRWFDQTDVGEIADLLVREITDGVGSGAVRPGIIGEIGCDQQYISAAEERSFRAAARAHLATGLTISTHAARWPTGHAQLAILEHEGVDPHRVIIGHCDTVADRDYHLAMAQRGCFVEFDGFGSDDAYYEQRALQSIARLAERGHLAQVLISHDNFLPTHLHAHGGNGFDYIVTTVVPKLRALGFADDEVETLMIHNPCHALSGAG
jgi:predicted metal-dependent phosphotriesterase family hydrolase